MAVPGNKRRKLEHVSSDTEDDGASFASFGDGSEDEEPVKNSDAPGESDEDMDEIEGSQDIEDEEDEVGDIEDGDKIVAKPSPQPKGITKEDTAREIGRPKGQQALRGALASANSSYNSGTFKSNIFKLQVDELLEQIRPRHGKREAAAEEALHALKKTIEQIPARAPQSVEQAERELLKEKIGIPFPNPRPPKDAKYKLEFAKPANINVVGSHALKISNRSRDILEVDMVIQMPSSLFQEKDYLNHRYFYKRAFYLACLASGLKKSQGKEFEIQFQEAHDNPLCPCLAIRPSQKTSASSEKKPIPKWQINVLLSIAQDIFPNEKLRPDRNCVRSSAISTDDDSITTQAPTPFYSSSLRSNMLVTPYLKSAHKAATNCSAFRDACLLGASWLRQRGFGSALSAGGFGNFEWSALMALLLQGGGPGGRPILSEGYSSYQLLKATLQLLALKDFSKQPFVVGSDALLKPLGDDLPVVWDAERSHNLLFKMAPWSYRLLQSAAKTTLAMLGDQHFDGFEATFILRADNDLMRFDQVIEIDQTTLNKGPSVNDFESQVSLHKLYDVLHRGLGDRVSLINVRPTPPSLWDIGTARPTQRATGIINVGLAVNPDNVNRTVDHGPPAEDKADAAAFRQFWGEKAELRRFKDGSILESLVWTAGEKIPSVLEQVVRCLLLRHFGPDLEKTTKFVGAGLANLVRNSTSTLPFHPLMEAYKRLETDLRGLEGMPLTIRQLMPADAQLRFASIETPMAGRSSQSLPPASVTISFEGSGRWPDDLIAIQRTKIAFLLKFSELLRSAVRGTTTRIGLENQETPLFNQAHLDILYNTGASFRLRIHHETEQFLLQKALKDKSLDPKSRESSAAALAIYKRDAIATPIHTQSLAQLCRRHPALSGTLRLVKKWFASHLLANHIAEETIELLVARTFVQPWPYMAPASVQTGFLRTLAWLARWDWRVDPLIVDLSGSAELKQPEVQAIRTRFEAWRKLDPAMNRVVLFAASSADTEGTTWTDGRPSKVVAGRMTALARAAISAVETKTLDVEVAELFVSSTADYDFVLHLDPALTGRKKKASVFKNLELDTKDDITLTGYDAVEAFVAELETLYGGAVLFFSGGAEKSVVAGLWNPQTAPRSWKVNLAYATIPVKSAKEGVEARIDKEAVLKEIARLGGDLVRRVEVNR